MVYTQSDGLRDREYDKFVEVQAGSQTAIAVSVVSGTINIGSVSATVDSIYVQSGTAYVSSGNVFVNSGNIHITDSSDNIIEQFGLAGAVGSPGLGSVTPIGGPVIGSSYTEVGAGSLVSLWLDSYGRQVDKSTNLATLSTDVSDIAPALTQTINSVNLNAVGSATDGHSGAWVNVSNYYPKTIYYNFTSGTTGSMVCELEASPDAGSTAFSLGSHIFEDDSLIYETLEEHHEYIRTRTSFNEGGTLTTTITGRGGK